MHYNACIVKSTLENNLHDAPQAFLTALGLRVRAARARHGMTRKDLAKHSQVSERHLAQVESGKGNISVVLLRQIAEALSTPVSHLLEAQVEEQPDRRLIDGVLYNLTSQQLAEAREMIEARFSRQANRHQRLALIGLRGAGKSTLGRLVAAQAGVPFVELADEIEGLGGMDLSEIFELSGQAGFRQLEHQALRACIAAQPSFVMATGGGIVSDPATFQTLLGECFTIWIQADPEDHMNRVVAQGDQRPMAGNRRAMQDLKRILESREALYAQADTMVSTSGKTAEQSAREVIAAWRNKT